MLSVCESLRNIRAPLHRPPCRKARGTRSARSPASRRTAPPSDTRPQDLGAEHRRPYRPHGGPARAAALRPAGHPSDRVPRDSRARWPLVLDDRNAAPNMPTVRTLANATLTLVLSWDSSRIDGHTLRRESTIPVRPLGIGLPHTRGAWRCRSSNDCLDDAALDKANRRGTALPTVRRQRTRPSPRRRRTRTRRDSQARPPPTVRSTGRSRASHGPEPRLPANATRRSSEPAGAPSLRARGSQGRGRRQRRHARLDHADARR